ncbi:MAG: glycosyltransferase family 2 protein [Ignavibacteriae bacterium]|nr:glycosyltransferase family 2 protein [Ignavibacteriota bacterium]
MSPDVSIIIVTYNSASYIEQCIHSIHEHSQQTSFEIIIVDNCSLDTTVQIIESKFPQAKIFQNQHNVGFASANNQGIEASEGKYILLLNPDTEFKSNLLQESLTFLKHHPDVGCVGPQILNVDGSIQRTGVSFPSLWNSFVEIFFLEQLFPSTRIFGRHRRLFDNPNEEHIVDYLQGSCLMFPKQVLQKLAGMDERFFLYFEETDLCYRLKQEGWKTVYVPQAKLLHYGGSGSEYYNEFRLLNYHKSFLLFHSKHYSQTKQIVFRLILFARAFVRGCTFVVLSFRPNYVERAVAYFKTALYLSGVKK